MQFGEAGDGLAAALVIDVANILHFDILVALEDALDNAGAAAAGADECQHNPVVGLFHPILGQCRHCDPGHGRSRQAFAGAGQKLSAVNSIHIM